MDILVHSKKKNSSFVSGLYCLGWKKGRVVAVTANIRLQRLFFLHRLTPTAAALSLSFLLHCTFTFTSTALHCTPPLTALMSTLLPNQLQSQQETSLRTFLSFSCRFHIHNIIIRRGMQHVTPINPETNPQTLHTWSHLNRLGQEKIGNVQVTQCYCSVLSRGVWPCHLSDQNN